MEYSKPNIDDLYAKLSIEDEEEGGVFIRNGEIKGNKESFVLTGTFLTDKNINCSVMQIVTASLWRPNEGVEIHDLGGFRYWFVFYHVMNLNKVLEGGSWLFEKNALCIIGYWEWKRRIHRRCS